MLNAADFGEANCVSKICHTNLTGLLSPDLLFVYVSNVFIFFILKWAFGSCGKPWNIRQFDISQVNVGVRDFFASLVQKCAM